MKIIFFFLIIGLVSVTPAHTQIRPGDGNAPLRTDTTKTWTRNDDSTALTILQDVSNAFDKMEQSIELMYDKLKEQTKDKIDDINKKINALNEQVEKLKAQLEKLDKMLKRMDEEMEIIRASLEERKKKALDRATELKDQKRTGDLQKYSQTIKTKIQKDEKDSLRSIRSRYPAYPDNHEQELAKKLADELKKVGVKTNENELKEITDAITKGGPAATAIALMIISNIGEIEINRQPLENAAKKKTEVSEKEFQELVRSAGIGKDTSLWISQYLRLKLSQIKKDGH